MNKTDLVNVVANETGLAKKDVDAVVAATLKAITAAKLRKLLQGLDAILRQERLSKSLHPRSLHFQQQKFLKTRLTLNNAP